MADWYLDQALERSRERLQNAEQNRRVQEALAAAPRPSGWREQTLVLLGDWFVAVGHRLLLSVVWSSSEPMSDATYGL